MPEWWAAVGGTPPPAAAPAAAGAPASAGGSEDVEGYIRQAASKRGIDPDVAIRVAQSEGGLVPARRGTFKTGSSWYPFQLHWGGPGYEHLGTTAGLGNSFTAQTGYQPGDPTAWRAATDYALDAAAKSGWGAWYGARNQGITGYQGINRNAAAAAAPAPAGAARVAPTATPSDGPDWWQGVPGARDAALRYGRDEAPGVQLLPIDRQDAPATRELLGAAPAAGSGPAWWGAVAGGSGPATPAGAPTGVRPVAGDVITKAGQPYWSFGGGAHAGIDIAAKAGTPVRSPVAGEVVANLAAGQNPLGLSKGYGRAVAVRDAAGDVHVFGHGAPDFGYLPVGTKVNVGDVISTVGSPKTKLPGEATEGEHLHWEIRGGGDYGKQIDPERWLPTRSVPATNAPRKAITTEPGPAWWSAV
jgi:murein DD-endopeptidase MepM/ murein hydrolase activator NlpD